MRTTRVIVMNGGGTESAALLHMLSPTFDVVSSVFVRAGYPGAYRQAEAAEALADHYAVSHHEVALDFGTDTTHVWADGVTLGPAVGWTALILSIGVAVGRSMGVDEVYFGQTWDASKLRQAFDLMMETAGMATWRPELMFPFSGVEKRDLGAPRSVLEMTDSCFADPVCGVCKKCRYRQEAIDAAF